MLHNSKGLTRGCNAYDIFISGNGLQCGNCGVWYRLVSNEELADLSNEWENPTVDTRKYYQNVNYAYEVDKETYLRYKNDGGLCQEYNGKFYIA